MKLEGITFITTTPILPLPERLIKLSVYSDGILSGSPSEFFLEFGGLGTGGLYCLREMNWIQIFLLIITMVVQRPTSHPHRECTLPADVSVHSFCECEKRSDNPGMNHCASDILVKVEQC